MGHGTHFCAEQQWLEDAVFHFCLELDSPLKPRNVAKMSKVLEVLVHDGVGFSACIMILKESNSGY